VLTFLALTVVPLAALTLIMLAAVWFTRQVAERMVGRKHRLLESIVKTGEIPAAWRKAGYLAKLDDLTRYAETSPFIADEDTRDALLDRLAEVREAWAAGRALGS
jgi:hypothetical protein